MGHTRNGQTHRTKRQTVHKTEKVMFTQKSLGLHWKVQTSQVTILQKQIKNAYWSYLESGIFSDRQGPGHKKVLQLC